VIIGYQDQLATKDNSSAISYARLAEKAPGHETEISRECSGCQ